jgi:hypothetical protein
MSDAGAAPSAKQLVAALVLLARTGRSFETVLAGASMGEAIPDGAVVRIVPGDPKTLIPGDVFAFHDASGRIVAHRLVRRGRRRRARDFVIALGDGNRFPDPPIAIEAILGKVVAYSDGTTWHDVPPRGHRSPIDALMSAAAVQSTVVTMEVHVPLATWIAGFVVWRKT